MVSLEGSRKIDAQISDAGQGIVMHTKFSPRVHLPQAKCSGPIWTLTIRKTGIKLKELQVLHLYPRASKNTIFTRGKLLRIEFKLQDSGSPFSNNI